MGNDQVTVQTAPMMPDGDEHRRAKPVIVTDVENASQSGGFGTRLIFRSPMSATGSRNQAATETTNWRSKAISPSVEASAAMKTHFFQLAKSQTLKKAVDLRGKVSSTPRHAVKQANL